VKSSLSIQPPCRKKPLGQAGGLGWQGKHTNLLSRDWGNWAFLARSSPHWIFNPDAPEVDSLPGSLPVMLYGLPTNAFSPAPYQLDGRGAAISYLNDAKLRRAGRIWNCAARWATQSPAVTIALPPAVEQFAVAASPICAITAVSACP